jgi:hypothetical protein
MEACVESGGRAVFTNGCDQPWPRVCRLLQHSDECAPEAKPLLQRFERPRAASVATAITQGMTHLRAWRTRGPRVIPSRRTAMGELPGRSKRGSPRSPGPATPCGCLAATLVGLGSADGAGLNNSIIADRQIPDARHDPVWNSPSGSIVPVG